jgi:hypothetical protein
MERASEQSKGGPRRRRRVWCKPLPEPCSPSLLHIAHHPAIWIKFDSDVSGKAQVQLSPRSPSFDILPPHQDLASNRYITVRLLLFVNGRQPTFVRTIDISQTRILPLLIHQQELTHLPRCPFRPIVVTDSEILLTPLNTVLDTNTTTSSQHQQPSNIPTGLASTL